jgi:plasmid stabilization system protein ParE
MSGQVPPAGPQWVRGLAMPDAHALSYDKPLCASLDGFTLHAATRAGGFDDAGREALLRYVLRPPIAQERVEPQKGGLVRIALKRAYADGTIAVDMDPLSLLCRLATAVQVDKIEAWWRRNRLGAPDLFTTELAATLVALTETPTLGVEYRARTATVRRVLLRRAHYHLYFVVEADRVFVVAVWSAFRGRGPRL